jgi:cell division protein FtsB
MKSKVNKWKEWVIAGGLAVMAVRSGQNVWKLYLAGDRLAEVRVAVGEAEAENARLKARLEEVTSSAFVEREAREKLGMGRKGEVIVILPDRNGGEAEKQDKELANWEKWWKAYIGL